MYGEKDPQSTVPSPPPGKTSGTRKCDTFGEVQVEPQGKKGRKLHSVGNRGLNSVWLWGYAELFGLLPKAVGSHWIILSRRMICFRRVVWVSCGVHRHTVGMEQRESVFQGAWGATCNSCVRWWGFAQGNREKCTVLRGLVRRGEVGNLSQLHLFALGDLADSADGGRAGKAGAHMECLKLRLPAGTVLSCCSFKWIQLSMAKRG